MRAIELSRASLNTGWSDDGTAYSGPVDRRLDQARRLRLLDEPACVCDTGIAPLGHRHGVRIDPRSTIEDAGPRQAVRRLEEARLYAEDRIGLTGLQRLQRAAEAWCSHDLGVLERPGKEDIRLRLLLHGNSNPGSIHIGHC